jgi:hypothetical protein
MNEKLIMCLIGTLILFTWSPILGVLILIIYTGGLYDKI